MFRYVGPVTSPGGCFECALHGKLDSDLAEKMTMKRNSSLLQKSIGSRSQRIAPLQNSEKSNVFAWLEGGNPLPPRLLKDSYSSNGLSAFTLIELLVVIAIIMTLIGLLFGGISAVQDGARRKKTAVSEQAIMNAIKGYRNDNDAWPGQTQGQNDHYYYAGSGDGDARTILGTSGFGSGSGLTNNPRNINYLELQPGMFDGTNFLDAWKNPMIVAQDENMDGVIMFSGSYGKITFSNNVTITDGVAIVSGGSAPASGNKWVCSWQ